MKIFDILKQQGLFSNDIRTRIKNRQITINGEVVTSDIDLDIITISDVTRKTLIDLNDIDNSIVPIVFDKFGGEVFNISSDIIEKIKNIFNKLNINLSELLRINIGEVKEILNDFLSQEINIAVTKESGEFICELGKNNVIFITQMKMFGFENLFDSNINNDLTDILNQHFLIKISKKDSIIVKKKNG